MKLGTLDIKKAYLGTFLLTHNNAFVQEEPLIPLVDSEVFYIRATGPSQNIAYIGLSSLSSNLTLQYSRDLVTWTTMDINTTIQLDVSQLSQVVYLRGKLTGNNTSSDYTLFTVSGGALGGFTIGGNIMCLYDYETIPTTITYEYAFYKLFNNCSALRLAHNILNYATTLANYCYNSMFLNCYGLIVAPTLPVTTLANYCYQSMFQGCISLSTAPELPATTLVSGCYSNMFNGCSSLNYIKCLAVGGVSLINIANWVYGVASAGTFYKLPNSASWTSGTSGIPTGWTVQLEIPYEFVDFSLNGLNNTTPFYGFMVKSDYASYSSFLDICFGTSSGASGSAIVPRFCLDYNGGSYTDTGKLDRSIKSLPTILYNGDTYYYYEFVQTSYYNKDWTVSNSSGKTSNIAEAERTVKLITKIYN